MNHTLSSAQVFDGQLLKVYKDQVRTDGGIERTREYIKHPGAAAIVAVDAQRQVTLVKQYRYALRRYFYELPAGKLDPGEGPYYAAQRELLEETGLSASKWTMLTKMHGAIGYSDEEITIYLAQELTQGAQALDEGEELELIQMPLDDAMDMVISGQITDAKTMIGIMRAVAFV